MGVTEAAAARNPRISLKDTRLTLNLRAEVPGNEEKDAVCICSAPDDAWFDTNRRQWIAYARTLLANKKTFDLAHLTSTFPNVHPLSVTLRSFLLQLHRVGHGLEVGGSSGWEFFRGGKYLTTIDQMERDFAPTMSCENLWSSQHLSVRRTRVLRIVVHSLDFASLAFVKSDVLSARAKLKLLSGVAEA